ncbi:hypothetical protein J6590_010770 [Homalodisca vitripennis]|nr:hypothetical protein J6590_010770 [Homalodisca vitripennis]
MEAHEPLLSVSERLLLSLVESVPTTARVSARLLLSLVESVPTTTRGHSRADCSPEPLNLDFAFGRLRYLSILIKLDFLK